MKAYYLKSIVPVFLSFLMLISCVACGLNGLLASGGIGGSGIISIGTIAAFGSIVVNGTKFDTGNAVIIVDGEEIGVGDNVILDNLDIGMVVTVEATGTDDDAIADQVIFNNNVDGPIESIFDINSSAKELNVLGQTVVVNAVSELKGVTFETIALNDVVKVSGFLDDTGIIWATFIEKTGEFVHGLIVEVQGFITNLDAGLETFEINDLTVDYSLADISTLPGGVPTEDLFVEVEGTLDAAGGKMFATAIEPGDEGSTGDVDSIEVMGFVTEFVSGFEFTVGNQKIEADENTEFVDGTVGDVAPGVKLEAEGSMADGILFAGEIEFWEPGQIELSDFVTNFVSIYEFTIGDQVVHTNDETVFEDGTPGDIEPGVLIEVKGRIADDILIADKVSFEEE